MNRLIPLFFLLAFLVPAHAHEVRPGYIEITEVARDSFDIVWKQPVRSAGANAVAGLGLRPVFPENCARLGDSRMRRLPGALVEKFSLTCDGGLFGQSIGVEGLQRTITDVLVQLALIDGGRYSLRLTADAPVQTFSGGGTFLMAYFGLGVEHLVFGLDHILFVLGLVLLVQGWRSLIYVITAFTLAHSLTLGLSMLGRISAPSAVVEAIIALSILFVAIELLQPPEKRSALAARYPQAMAFGFGLLHGFGFAGVLGEIGLPRDVELAALALFNIGLEVGQLLVVAAMVLFMRFVKPALLAHEKWAPALQQVPIIAIGGISVYWLLDRLAGLGG
ncbi:HupE/UreJ family protein [Alphaproteobacteria bacterium]|nr:HupE/UreJ family protein [Alphaproteobacteria bacterium]MDA8625480.1 HupE/UreJ family protein [Alphaproteobacteria bacterium]MDA8642567.1 HupE/UreJ family protein [Alphaproteobacteria bacterium]MDB2461923.1 HupE/UreJ family protein [Alphaproteobacteria bacterium]MDB2477017.1 HupE/UreJ family protein [Alphaproteobacteria bacterium]